jgi:hypothetical protein
MIRIYPELLVKAITKKLAGAVRLWALMRDFDKAGSGKVNSQEFKNYLISLKKPTSTIYRWISEALKLSLISETKKNEYYYIGLAQCALKIGASKVSFSVDVPLDKLINKGWRSIVWGAYLVQFKRLISREALFDLTGIQRQTQRQLEIGLPKELKIQYIKNYLDEDVTEAHSEAYQKYHGGKAIVINERLVRRLPDTKKTQFKRNSKGRIRKAQSSINLVLKYQQGNDARIEKLYYASLKGALQRSKKHERDEQKPDIFYLSDTSNQDKLGLHIYKAIGAF